MTSTRDRSFLRVHITFTLMLAAVYLIALGCGGSSPAGGTGKGGSSAGGSTVTGAGGSNTTGAGGSNTTGAGGSNTTGAGGSNVTGAGGSNVTGAGGSSTTGTGGRGGTGTGGSGTGGTTVVGTTQCSDGIDNDRDGKIDYNDPECVGAGDNDESSFATGISGDNMDPCMQDCFFDGNSGAGDDKCNWQLKCDPASTNAKCPYDANYAQQHATECSLSASQSTACITNCRKFVPNGCDCFGCCAIPGGPTILLATTCTAADFNDPVKCPRCTQVTQCSNPCDRCEICIGKPTIPADCVGTTPDGGTPTDGGTPVPVCNDSDFHTTCGPGGSVPADGCPAGLGCLTGCCQPLP